MVARRMPRRFWCPRSPQATWVDQFLAMIFSFGEQIWSRSLLWMAPERSFFLLGCQVCWLALKSSLWGWEKVWRCIGPYSLVADLYPASQGSIGSFAYFTEAWQKSERRLWDMVAEQTRGNQNVCVQADVRVHKSVWVQKLYPVVPRAGRENTGLCFLGD